MDKENIIKTVIAGAGTVFTALFGAWDMALKILILFMCLDYFTGWLRGVVKKELSSDVGFKGLAKKSVILVILIVAVSLDRLMNNGTWVFRTLICYFYIANEGLSIIENSATLGLPIHPKIKQVLLQLQQEGNKKEIKEQDK